MQGKPVCSVLYPAPLQQTTQRNPASKHPSSLTGSCLWTGNLPIITEGGDEGNLFHVILRSLQVWPSDAGGQLPRGFLWCGDNGLRKGRASAILEKSRSACHFWSTPSPCPHKGLQVIIAHIQRDLCLWEKNYLHLFRFIYIHSWILIQKEKNLESDKCLQTRYLQIDFAHLAWCGVNDNLYWCIQGNGVSSPGPLSPTFLQASFVSPVTNKLIADSQLCVHVCP